MIKEPLPIGVDDFAKIRREGYHYVDKTLMIKEFIEMQDEVALIARPRRFGKTTDMAMLREFFDITKDSKAIFDGLAIMGTEYAKQINTRPVIFLTFKDCRARTAEELLVLIKKELYREYLCYEERLRGWIKSESYGGRDFYGIIDWLRSPDTPSVYLESSLYDLTQIVNQYYKIAPVLLIDDYDQPILSSYEYGYHDGLGAFFSNFYGSALHGNSALGQALITGAHRVAKESVFSQFSSSQIYTVTDKEYAPYFGLSEQETRELLDYYGLELNEEVQKMYGGYQIGGMDIYNPWSVINYAKRGILDNYRVKTSVDILVKKGIRSADPNFRDKFERLILGESVEVWITMDTSFVEHASPYSLWGLLVNEGFLTVMKRIDAQTAVVRIPNGEMMAELRFLLAEISGMVGLEF